MAAELRSRGLRGELLAEGIGMFILILLGNGAVAVNILTGAIDLYGVGIMWAFGVVFAVYAVGATSGAHINPAVTIGLAAFKGFSWAKVAPYIIAQLIGAFLGAIAIHLSWRGVMSAFEVEQGIERGEPGSQLSAMVYYTFTPNPAAIGTDQAAWDQVPLWTGFLTEVIITMLLVAGIMYLTDAVNSSRPLANLAPWFIALLVAALVIYAAPITMAALNPARDLGPRIFALLAGWGEIAIPGPRNEMWIPIAGPIVGGIIGGALYTYLIRPYYPITDEPGRVAPEARTSPADDD